VPVKEKSESETMQKSSPEMEREIEERKTRVQLKREYLMEMMK